MKFKIFIIASLLSHLFSPTNSNVANNNDTTTAMPTHKMTSKTPVTTNFLNSISCYVSNNQFDDLDNEEILKQMYNEIKTRPTEVLKRKTGSEAGNYDCGLLITKNNTSNQYNFKYNFLNKPDCVTGKDVICNQGNCSTTAMKCCAPNLLLPCNLYGLEPKQNTSCLQDNNTSCYEITWGGELPTTMLTTSDASNNSYRINWVINSLIILLFNKSLQNID